MWRLSANRVSNADGSSRNVTHSWNVGGSSNPIALIVRLFWATYSAAGSAYAITPAALDIVLDIVAEEGGQSQLQRLSPSVGGRLVLVGGMATHSAMEMMSFKNSV